MTKYSRARLFIEVGLLNVVDENVPGLGPSKLHKLHTKGRLFKEVPDTDDNRRRFGLPDRPKKIRERGPEEVDPNNPRFVEEDGLLLTDCGGRAAAVTSPEFYLDAEYALYYTLCYTDKAGLRKLRECGWLQKDPGPALLKSGW